MRRGGVLRLKRSRGGGDGIIVLESMRIRCPHENARAAFLDFSTLTHSFQNVRFQALSLQVPWVSMIIRKVRDQPRTT